MPAALPPPLLDDVDSFHFAPADARSGIPGLEKRFGPFVAGWDTADTRKLMQPGMKVIFYGRPDASCTAATRDGAVAASSDPRAGRGLSWTPERARAGCRDPESFAERQPFVALAADGALPGLELFTPTGPDPSGKPPFFTPWNAGGQNGRGDNAFIEGTFVAFRQAPVAARAHHPWAQRDARAASDARLRTTQSVRQAVVGPDPGASAAVQAKQQVIVAVLDTDCKQGPGRPCQFQYLLNTAIYRAGVTDWSRVGWFTHANIMFDPVQGGIPVVDSGVGAAGTDALDGRSGLPIFTSHGAATQHGEFENAVFDVTISFGQLQNALRAITGKARGTPATAVSARDLADMWGPGYSNPGAWILLDVLVAQEVHNPVASRNAAIDGFVHDLYVGPKD